MTRSFLMRQLVLRLWQGHQWRTVPDAGGPRLVKIAQLSATCRIGEDLGRNAGRSSVVKNDVKQRGMDLQLPIVLNEAKLPEFIQKKAYPGAGRSDHVSQRRLRDIGDHGFRNSAGNCG
jgi:hypothetical protein